MAIGELSPARPDHQARRSAAAVLAVGMAVLLVLILGALGAPSRLVAVSGLGVLGLGLLTRPKTATFLFVAVLYLNLPVVAMRFHGVDTIIVAIVPLLLGIPLASYLVIRREPVVVTRALGWILAYTAVLILAALFSTDVTEAAGSVATFLSEGLVLYLLLTNAIRSVEILKGVVVVLLVVGTFLGGLSIFQELTGTYENQYWGFAQTREVDPLEAATGSDRLERLSGPIGSKNRYAQAMLVLLPFSLFAFVTARTRRQRVLAVISAIAILGGMSLTYSRGAAVAVGALLMLAVLLRYVRVRHAIAVALVMLVGVFAFLPTYAERIESVAGVGSLVGEGDGADGAILGRATSNLAALNVFADHPILGVGPGRYQADYSQAYANEIGLRRFTTPRRAHNLYLEIAADTGVLGIVTFMGAVGTTLLGLWRVRRRWMERRPEYAHLATAIFLSVTGYMLSGVFLHLAYVRYFWLLIAIANSAIWILHREAERVERAEQVERAGRAPIGV